VASILRKKSLRLQLQELPEVELALLLVELARTNIACADMARLNITITNIACTEIARTDIDETNIA
jgi:hypothetical protein